MHRYQVEVARSPSRKSDDRTGQHVLGHLRSPGSPALADESGRVLIDPRVLVRALGSSHPVGTEPSACSISWRDRPPHGREEGEPTYLMRCAFLAGFSLWNLACGTADALPLAAAAGGTGSNTMTTGRSTSSVLWNAMPKLAPDGTS